MPAELISETWEVSYGDFSRDDGVVSKDFPTKREARQWVKGNLQGTPYAIHKVVIYLVEHGVA